MFFLFERANEILFIKQQVQEVLRPSPTVAEKTKIQHQNTTPHTHQQQNKNGSTPLSPKHQKQSKEHAQLRAAKLGRSLNTREQTGASITSNCEDLRAIQFYHTLLTIQLR
jgi:hypothetical protein